EAPPLVDCRTELPAAEAVPYDAHRHPRIANEDLVPTLAIEHDLDPQRSRRSHELMLGKDREAREGLIDRSRELVDFSRDAPVPRFDTDPVNARRPCRLAGPRRLVEALLPMANRQGGEAPRLLTENSGSGRDDASRVETSRQARP